MTLKEKIDQTIWVSSIREIVEERQKEKDDFAIDFAEWINVNAYKFPTKTTTKELLEIYKEKL